MIVCFNLCFLCYLAFRSEFVFCLLLSVSVCCLLPFDGEIKIINSQQPQQDYIKT